MLEIINQFASAHPVIAAIVVLFLVLYFVIGFFMALHNLADYFKYSGQVADASFGEEFIFAVLVFFFWPLALLH